MYNTFNYNERCTHISTLTAGYVSSFDNMKTSKRNLKHITDQRSNSYS